MNASVMTLTPVASIDRKKKMGQCVNKSQNVHIVWK